MSYYLGSFTQGSTGNQSFSLPFTPTGLKFTISAKSSGAENDVAHFSQGMANSSVSYAHSIMTTPELQISRYSSSYCITHYAIVSSSTYRVISATLVSLDTNGFTLNFDRASVDYQVTVEAYA